ncbi:unnamed protein product [Ilex paraguariensis]|uniref:Uncharacterized protein n=1 Tax=Ilex paraguariensis TaxID=185542 RepID=A0ABC8R0C0_9AQUA
MAERKSCVEEFLQFEEKILKLQNDLVASQEKVKKAVEEKEALSLKVSELSFALKKKDSKLSNVQEKKEFELAEAVKVTTMAKVKEYKHSFDFKKEMLEYYNNGFEDLKTRGMLAFPSLTSQESNFRMILPQSLRRKERMKRRLVMRPLAQLLWILKTRSILGLRRKAIRRT